MEKKLKVLIADNSNQFATQCQKELETQGYEVSTMENDGAKVFDAIAKQKFDVILMDVFMTNEDAVDVLEYYQTHTVEKPIIAVLSTISSEELEKQTMSLGADYFFIKPISPAQVAKRITRLTAWKNEHKAEIQKGRAMFEQDMDVVISDIMRQIGVPAHIKGYHYLRTAIKYCLDDSEMLSSVTKIFFIQALQRNIKRLPHVLKEQFAMQLRLLGTEAMLMFCHHTSVIQFSRNVASRQIRNL